MMGLFDPENEFWNFIGKLADVFCLGVLWVLTSIPLFTIGASTTALYDFTVHLTDDREDNLLHGYFTSFKRHFKKATALWGLQAAALAFSAVDAYAAWRYFSVSDASPWAVLVLGATGCVVLVVVMTSLYLYPLLATFDFSVKKTVGNSFVMAMGNLPTTLTMLLLYALAAVAFYYVSGLFFVWFALAAFFSSYFLVHVFRRYTENDEAEDKPEER